MKLVHGVDSNNNFIKLVKLRNEAKTLLDNSQSKLDSANEETNKIIEEEFKDFSSDAPKPNVDRVEVSHSTDI